MSTAIDVVDITLPAGWYALPLEADEPESVPSDEIDAALRTLRRLAVAGRVMAAFAAVYQVGDEVTVGSAVVSWLAVPGSPPRTSATLAALADEIAADRTGPVTSVTLAAGPAVWWSRPGNLPSMSSCVISYALAVGDGVLILTFAALGARPYWLEPLFALAAQQVKVSTTQGPNGGPTWDG